MEEDQLEQHRRPDAAHQLRLREQRSDLQVRRQRPHRSQFSGQRTVGVLLVADRSVDVQIKFPKVSDKSTVLVRMYTH